VRVNSICPGHIVTENMEKRWEKNPKGLKFFEEQYPVRRTGLPEDIANGVTFLCSKEASFITGHSLVIDGGLSIQLQEDFGVDQAKYAQKNEIEFPY
jgi:NAD(P)-dependent dehydrogenase (short-subunit alcohol dehydrogenase family)